jgi:26S proteasome regulatory subunit N8
MSFCVSRILQGSTEAPKVSFQHITSEIGALEAEEVGVEHLLRDVKDTSISKLATHISAKFNSLKSLIAHLNDMRSYLDLVVSGKLPINHEILNNMQDVFNLLPNLNVEEMSRSFSSKTNDMTVVIYLATLIRSIIALHNLINNKIDLRENEKKNEQEQQQQQQQQQTKKADAQANGPSVGNGNASSSDASNTDNANNKK